jgi:hypothetical protein
MEIEAPRMKPPFFLRRGDAKASKNQHYWLLNFFAISGVLSLFPFV